MNLRFKLLSPILAAGAIFGATLNFYWLPRFQADEVRETLEEQQTVVNQLRIGLIDALIASDLDSVYRTITQYLQNYPHWTEVTLHNAKGLRLFPLTDRALPDTAQQLNIRKEVYYKDTLLGTLLIRIDASSSLNLVAQRLRETQILFWSLLIFCSIAIYLLLDQIIYKPIHQITASLKAIGDGDYALPIPGPPSTDLAPLYNALHQMKKNRQIAEELLRQSSQATARALKELEDYKFAIDQHEILVTLDELGNIVYANNKFSEIIGTEKNAMYGLPYQRHIAAQHGEHFILNVLNTVMLGRIWQSDVLHTGSDGRHVWLNVSAILFDHVAERGEKFILLATDISARKNIETALREQQALLQSVVSNVPIVLWAIDAQGVFTLSTGQGLRDLGWKPGQVVGQSAYEVYKHHTDIIDNIRRVLTGDTFVAEIQVSERWYETHYAPIHDERGTITGALGVSVDTTLRRKSDLQMRLASRVFEESSEGIIITNHKKEIILVNEAFTRVTGYHIDEALGKTPKLLSSGRHDAQFYAQLWGELARAGHWSGEIWNKRKNGDIYPEWLAISAVRDDKNAITNYVGIFSDITDRKRAQLEIEHLAHHDALTGLPNRVLLHDRFEQAAAHAARERTKVALMFLDLDHFKSINDSLGHAVGDELLKTVARRLSSCVRQTDTLSRQGGDEFLVIMPRVDHIEQAATVARKIIHTLSQTITIDDQMIQISASVGIALFPDDGQTFEELIKSADSAMYQSKQQGRNQFLFYNNRLAVATAARELLPPPKQAR